MKMLYRDIAFTDVISINIFNDNYHIENDAMLYGW